jgi:hypothetical protein
VPIYAAAFSKYATRSSLWETYPSNFLLTVILLFTIYMSFRRRMTARLGAALVALAGGVAHFVLQQKGFPYHMIPLMAFAFPLAFWALDEVISSRVVWQWCLGIGIAVVAIAPQWEQGSYLAVAGDGFAARKHAQAERLAAYLKANLRSGETVQICEMVDSGADALLRAGVRQPTRFTSDYLFYCHDSRLPDIKALRREFLDGLKRNKPRFFVVFKTCWFLKDDYDRVDTFPELKSWLQANYVRRVDRGEYRILELRNN